MRSLNSVIPFFLLKIWASRIPGFISHENTFWSPVMILCLTDERFASDLLNIPGTLISVEVVLLLLGTWLAWLAGAALLLVPASLLLVGVAPTVAPLASFAYCLLKYSTLSYGIHDTVLWWFFA